MTSVQVQEPNLPRRTLAFYHDVIAEMKKVTSLRVYRILRRADRELLAKAETDWAFINYATGRPTRIPAEISRAFALLPAAR